MLRHYYIMEYNFFVRVFLLKFFIELYMNLSRIYFFVVFILFIILVSGSLIATKSIFHLFIILVSDTL